MMKEYDPDCEVRASREGGGGRRQLARSVWQLIRCAPPEGRLQQQAACSTRAAAPALLQLGQLCRPGHSVRQWRLSRLYTGRSAGAEYLSL